MRALLLALLLPLGAYAQAPTTEEMKQLHDMQRDKNVRVLNIDPAVIETTIVQLSVDGQVYKFVGERTSTGGWAGTSKEPPASMHLRKDKAGGLYGSILIPGKPRLAVEHVGARHFLTEYALPPARPEEFMSDADKKTARARHAARVAEMASAASAAMKSNAP